jgi:hypothetical protein
MARWRIEVVVNHGGTGGAAEVERLTVTGADINIPRD